MSAPLMLAAIFAIVGFVAGLEQAMRRVRAMRKRYQTMVSKKNQQVERLRTAGRESLALGREVRNNQRTADLLTEELSQFDVELQKLLQPENRIFVLDEKRGGNDGAWLVTLESAGPQPDSRQMPAWVGDRRFRVWATDEGAARTKVERRYSTDSGYRILAIAPAPSPTPSEAANSNG